MILLDSNIIIYSAQEEFSSLQNIFDRKEIFTSEIIRLEVLGFHKITKEQEEFFNNIFSKIKVLSINSEVIHHAIKFRKKYNLSIGDSIVSSTVFINELTLWTNNTDDYKRIKEINIQNPILSL